MAERLPYHVLELILAYASAPEPSLLIEPILEQANLEQDEAAEPSRGTTRPALWALTSRVGLPSLDHQHLLCKACLVSKTWYDVASRLLYRQPEFVDKYHRYGTRYLLRTVVESPRLAKHIKMLDLQLFTWDEPVGYKEKAVLRERVPHSIRKRYEEHAARYGRLVEGIYYRDAYEETAEEEKARRRWPIPGHVRRRVEKRTDPARFYDRILERRERPSEEWNWMDAMEECMEEQTCWTVLLSLLPNLTHVKMIAKETETTPVCVGVVPGSLSKLVWAQVSYGTCRSLSLRKLDSLAKAAPNLQTLVIDLPGEPVTSYQSGYGGEHDIAQMPVFANVTSLCLCHGFMNMEVGEFKELAACFPRLERLEIVKPEDKVEGSAQLSSSLHELASHVPKVRDLRMTLGGMADAGADLAPVAASVRALKGLQRLWVSVYSLNLDIQHGLIDVLPSTIRHLSISVEVYDRDTDALLHAIQELGREAGRSATRFPDLESIAVTDWAFHGPGEGEPWELPPDPERALAVRRVAGVLLANGIEFLVEGCRSAVLLHPTAQAIVELFGSDQKPDVEEMRTNRIRNNASYTMAHWGQGWS